MDAYLKYIYRYICVLLISGSPQLEILGPSLGDAINVYFEET